MRIQKPTSALIPDKRSREEQDKDSDKYQNDWIVDVHRWSSISAEVDPHEQSENEEEEARELGQLSPVQMMPRIEFEDEGVVDFVLIPDGAVDAEQCSQVKHEKITTIDLHEIACLNPNSWIPMPEKLSTVYESLDSKDSTGTNKHSVGKGASRQVIGLLGQAAQLSSRKLVISTLKVTSIKVFHSSDVTFQNITVDKPSLVDLLIQIPVRRSSIDSLVVFLIQLSKGCAIQQRIRLEQLQAAVKLLQGQLELAFSSAVRDLVVLWPSDVVSLRVAAVHGIQTGCLGHLLEGLGVWPRGKDLGLDGLDPAVELAVAGAVAVLARAVPRCVLLPIGVFRHLLDSAIAHFVQLDSENVQSLPGLFFLHFVKALHLIQLRVQKLKELMFLLTHNIEVECSTEIAPPFVSYAGCVGEESSKL